MKKLAKILVFLVALFTGGPLLFAQTDIAVSQFTLQPILYNAGFTGIENMGTGAFGVINQWAGLDGDRPLSLQASYSGPLPEDINPFNTSRKSNSDKRISKNALFGKKNGETVNKEEKAKSKGLNAGPSFKPFHAVGGVIWTQFTGPLQHQTFRASYAYHQAISAKHQIGYGIQAGFSTWQFQKDRVTLAQQNDPAFTSTGSVTPDLSIGGVLLHKDYYMGLSVNQLIPGSPHLGDSRAEAIPTYGSFQASWLNKGTPEFATKVSTLLNVNTKEQAQFRMQICGIYYDKLSFGLGMGNASSLQALVGYTHQKMISINYCYGRNLSEKPFQFGSNHEITIAYKNNYYPNPLFR